MKKIYFTLLTLFALSTFNSKAATGTIDLSGIELVTIDGDTFDLEQLQNDGYTLIFDFWATWCGPCLASIPALDIIWEEHGPDGDQTVMIFSIETDVQTNNEVAIINQYNIKTPVFLGEDNPSVRSSDFAYGGSIPYFTVVCPDGAWEDHTGGVFNPNTLLNKAVCFDNDAKIASSIEGSNCPNSSTWLPEFTVKNAGRTNLTSVSTEIKVDGVFHEVIDWNGSMQSGDEVSLAGTTPIEYTGVGNQNIEYNIISVNVGVDGNSKNNTLSKVKGFNISNSLDISLELIIDDYPEEMGYEISSSDGTVVSSASAGAYNNASSNPVINVTLPNAEECYTVKLTDSFGDGSGGFIVRNASAADIVTNTTPFTSLLESEFYVSFDNDNDNFANVIEDLNGSDKDDETSTPLTILNIINTSAVASFNVYPNPATDIFNVELEILENRTATIELLDVLGRVVSSQTANNFVNTFSSSNLNSGIYIVNVKSEGKVIANTKLIIK